MIEILLPKENEQVKTKDRKKCKSMKARVRKEWSATKEGGELGNKSRSGIERLTPKMAGKMI